MATPLEVLYTSPQAVKRWSKALMVATMQKTQYGKFSSSDGDKPFQILTDLTKGAGDQIKFDLLSQMANTYFGINGNTAMINAVAGSSTNEQNLVFYQETVEIEQKRMAHSWYRMNQQRSLHDFMKAAMRNLSDQWAQTIDRWAAVHLVGLSVLNAADTAGTACVADIAAHQATAGGGTAIEAHDPGHIMAGSSGVSFDPFLHLSAARWKAESLTTPSPLARINVDGHETFVMFIRPEQAASLTANSDWIAAQQGAGVRGMDNPIFSGALGTWGGIVVHVWHYLPYGSGASALQRYAVLCGKQALAVAFGNALDVIDQEKYGKDFVFAFVPRDQSDYGNIKGVSAGAIFGMRRTMFASATYGCLRVDSTDPNV